VKLLGGEMRVQSIVGRGSEFSFTIPLPVETPAARAAASLVPLNGRRALVVDDNETNRRIVSEMLRTAGMTVDEAPAGEAGLDALHRQQRAGKPYHLAILDFQMPGLDGFQLAAVVRADPDLRATRILLLTSAGQRGDGQRCRELGIEGYLTKPASRPELTEAVAAVLSADPSRERVVVTRHTIEEARRRLEILVAEDNPVNQEVAATMLRRRGHLVDLVDDGRAAVAAAARKHYDLVLMDIQMPELDGFEATRAIRALPAGADLPIVALTAHALSGERERCLAQGMNGYLAKPFKSHELYAIVEAMATPGAAPPSSEIPEPAAAGPAVSALDLDGFRATMREAGAEDAVESILLTFIATSPERMTALEHAAAAGDAHALERAAHAFKSAAATIGAKPLAAVLADLEQRGRSGQLDGVAADIRRAREANTAVVTELQKATGQ
jgi:CheY-like chemotaxis protein/HPt (histidine-containing phosphotransfer) domain-containing protein